MFLENMSNKKFNFEIEKRSSEASLARAGVIHTPHGDIFTPAFIPVGTKATVKALSVEDIKKIGGQAVLANTYHLYLQPGSEIVKKHGGFARMMNWTQEIKNNSQHDLVELESKNLKKRNLPTVTDSGGFQVFSLGAAFDTGVSKIATSVQLSAKQKQSTDSEGVVKIKSTKNQMAKIDEDGVTFKSFIDGSYHRFTPETSMQIQHDLGADIFFAFDECTSPLASRDYQISAMERTHRWAKRCIEEHKRLGVSSATGEQQALFAVVQGGAFEDLRKESAKVLGEMNVGGVEFDGFGIGGSFTKEDMGKTVKSATENLPENKPRHLLGIGEPIDFFLGIEYGIDTFDCVSPTRIARHGQVHSLDGKINITNAKYKTDMSLVCDDINCPANEYTKAYLCHLFRAEEMLAATIASAHNLHFLIKLVENIRKSILEDNFINYKKDFCDRYYKNNENKK
jgi:queuine tRNA-ribosyltransferase